MTRGRKPLLGLREAEEIGRGRGETLLTPGRREDYFELVVAEEERTVFVRVKRSRTKLIDPKNILIAYRREIIRLRKIPLTAVVARELWVRSPEGCWQFFRILGDRIIEIREDGTIFEGIDYPVADAGILGKPPLTEKSAGEDPRSPGCSGRGTGRRGRGYFRDENI